MSQIFEIVIFTAAIQDYADSILDYIDPDKKIFSKRLYRQHTEPVENKYSLKDLSILNRDLKRTIIIDNIPENFERQRANGIYIKSWYNDSKDVALRDLIPVLKGIGQSKCDDVRDYLKKYRTQLIEKIKKGSLNPVLEL